MKKRKVVPSFLTAMNLLCGFLAILINDPIHSFYLVLVGISFDFVDGLSARILNVPSAFGKELDSLADMVSFGVVPGFLYYHHVFAAQQSSGLIYTAELFVATLVPILAAIRLAKFNVKDGGKIGFEGLPSSAAALAIISIPFLIHQQNTTLLNGWLVDYISSYHWLSFTIPLLFSLLMVSKLPMFNFKQVGKGLKKNYIQIFYIVSLLLSLFLFRVNFWLSVPVAILWYVLLSLLTVRIWKH